MCTAWGALLCKLSRLLYKAAALATSPAQSRTFLKIILPVSSFLIYFFKVLSSKASWSWLVTWSSPELDSCYDWTLSLFISPSLVSRSVFDCITVPRDPHHLFESRESLSWTRSKVHVSLQTVENVKFTSMMDSTHFQSFVNLWKSQDKFSSVMLLLYTH